MSLKKHIAARRLIGVERGDTLAEAEEAMGKAEVTKVTRTHNELIARARGLADGAIVAEENAADGTYNPAESADWDSALINAIGPQAARKLFDLPEGTGNPHDDPRFAQCLRAYNAAATEAYDSHGKQFSPAADRALIDAAFAGQWR